MKLGKWENEMKGERGLKGKHGQARRARGEGRRAVQKYRMTENQATHCADSLTTAPSVCLSFPLSSSLPLFLCPFVEPSVSSKLN